MAFMDKNINFVLVGIIVIILVGLVGVSLYFQSNYEDLSNKYSEKEKQVDNLRFTINTLQNISMQLNSTLVSKTTDIENLSDQYTLERETKESLNATYIETKAELDNTKNELTNTKTELTTTKASLVDMTSKYTSANALAVNRSITITSYKSIIPDLRENMDILVDYVDTSVANENRTLAQCETYLEEIENVLEDIDKDFIKIEAVK